MNDQTIQAINQWATAIKNALLHVAPVVWRTATAVKQADSIGNLITGGLAVIVLVIVAFVCARYALKFFQVGHAVDLQIEHDADFTWPGVQHYIGGAAFTIATFVAACTAWSFIVPNLLDQWQWIGAFNPGLAVAHDIMVKALSQ